MVIVGGSSQLDGDGVENTSQNPWPLGLGIFDLTDMAFKDQHDADAAAYVSPSIVKDWYAKNDRFPQNIIETAKSWFATSSEAPQETPKDANSNSGSSGSGTSHTGAIAGGVVGGVIGLALIGGFTWFMVRRHRRRVGGGSGPVQNYNKPELPTDGPDHGRKTSLSNTFEPYSSVKSRSYPRYEADGVEMYESPSEHQKHEMPSHWTVDEQVFVYIDQGI